MHRRSLPQKFLTLVFPPQCDACSAPAAATGFCADCYAGLHPITAPYCVCCGVPLPCAGVELCNRCTQSPPPLRLLAAYRYAGPVRRCLLRLKNHDLPLCRRTMLPRFLQTLCAAAPFDAVVCVPSARRALLRRGYNPAAPWARAASLEFNVPVLWHALRRRPFAGMQKRLRRKDRLTNVRAAYVAGKQSVVGRRLLLIDDVIATGATLSACGEALLRAGAASVCGAAPALVLA